MRTILSTALWFLKLASSIVGSSLSQEWSFEHWRHLWSWPHSHWMLKCRRVPLMADMEPRLQRHPVDHRLQPYCAVQCTWAPQMWILGRWSHSPPGTHDLQAKCLCIDKTWWGCCKSVSNCEVFQVHLLMNLKLTIQSPENSCMVIIHENMCRAIGQGKKAHLLVMKAQDAKPWSPPPSSVWSRLEQLLPFSSWIPVCRDGLHEHHAW